MHAPRLLALFLVLASAGVAGAQVRLAEIAGTVTDESGAVLPGVTVTAVHIDTGQTRTAVTEGAGTYLITALPVGHYRISTELSGFRGVVHEDVLLEIGNSLRLDVKMQVATVQESVTVSGEAPLVDTTKSDLTGRINQRQVEDLPLSGRNWMNLAALAPGVKSEASGGQPTAGVGDTRMSKVYLDGGSVQNLSTVAVDIQVSKEVIGEFEVLTNRFDAMMGRAGTAVVNAVTKSGTDRFRGASFLYWRDDSLNAKDFFTNRVEPYQNQQYGGVIGGPLVRGRSHFLVSYERQKEPKTLSSNTGFAAYDEATDATDTRNLYFLRFDHSLSTNHRINTRLNRFDLKQPNSGIGGLITPSSSSNARFEIHRGNLGLNSVFGGKFVNQVLFTYMDSLRQWSRVDPGPQHVFPSFSIGGPPAGIGREHPFFWALRNDASYVFDRGGQHHLRFGGEIQHGNVQGVFLSQTNGSFFYNSNPANLATCCGGVDNTSWDRSQFPIPVRYTQALGDFTISSPNYIYAAYLQDDWTVGPRVTLNLGVRYDLETGSLATDQTGLSVKPRDNDINNFQPRVGFAWDLFGSGRTIVRGGGGLYYDQVWLNLTFNQIRTNTGRQVVVTTFNTANDPNFARNPLGGLGFDDFKRVEGAVNVTRFAEDAEQPHVWTGSFGIGQQLTSTLAFSADYVYQRSDSMLVTTDSNLFCCLPDGNALPVRAGTFPELGGAVAGAGRPDPRFNTITTYNFTGKSRYHGLQVGIDKRMANNYQFGISYLLSKTDDLGSSPNNMFDIDDDFSRSALDQRHRLVVNWVSRLPYELTFGGILSTGSGRPINPTTGGVDVNGDAQTAGDRPICGVDARFAVGCQQLGIPNGQRVPRNAFLSNETLKVDLRLARRFKVGGVDIDPGFEVFNLFNRRNYDPARYNRSLSSATFAAPGRSDLLPYLPRQMQLGVRVSF